MYDTSFIEDIRKYLGETYSIFDKYDYDNIGENMRGDLYVEFIGDIYIIVDYIVVDTIKELWNKKEKYADTDIFLWQRELGYAIEGG